MKNKFKKYLIFLMVFCVFGADVTGQGIKVFAADNVTIKITPNISKNIIAVGNTVNINASATINKKTTKNIIYEPIIPDVVTVSKKGIIKALATGETFIKMYVKGYPDQCEYIDIEVVERVINISGPDNYVAGKVYQLKASEKDVEWSMYNLGNENAHASIDAISGKIKVRNAGRFLVLCKSKDGKALGKVYIYAKGPIIDGKIITLDSIEINTDEHIVSINELVASGLLPEKVSVPYKYGKKIGKTDLTVTWKYDYIFDIGDYLITGYVEAPEGYAVSGGFFGSTQVNVNVNFTVQQTDIRKKIISIEPADAIIITEDKNICDYWSILKTYFKDYRLKCTLDDGSTVELPIGSIAYEKDFYGDKGEYDCKLYPKNTAGYDSGDIDGPYAAVSLKVNVNQTPAISTLYDIAEESYVIEYVTQEPLGI